MKLLFASNNKNKVNEIRALLPDGFELLGLNDIHFSDEIVESANTYEGNALIKAKTIFEKTGIPCFADDSGLSVDSLGGAPGVYSARYAGPEKNDEANCQKLIDVLEHHNNRSAQFITVIAFVNEMGHYFFTGKIEGEIIHEKRGQNGFGYDPLFVPKGWTKTFAEVSKEDKNEISHRALAFKSFMKFLNNVNKK